jgi:hypothetical protein
VCVVSLDPYLQFFSFLFGEDVMWCLKQVMADGGKDKAKQDHDSHRAHFGPEFLICKLQLS